MKFGFRNKQKTEKIGLPSPLLGQILTPYFDQLLTESAFRDPESSPLSATPQFTYLVMKNIWYANEGLSDKVLYERSVDVYIKDKREISRLKAKRVTNQREAILMIIDSGFRNGNPLDKDGSQYDQMRPIFINQLDEIDATFDATTKLFEKASKAVEGP